MVTCLKKCEFHLKFEYFNALISQKRHLKQIQLIQSITLYYHIVAATFY